MVRHGGNILEATLKYGLRDKTVIDFSSNINPLGFPPGLKKVIIGNIEKIKDYPDSECRLLRQTLAVKLNIPQDNLLIGNGSVELIFLATAALKLKRASIPVPAFGEYERAVELSGGKAVFPAMSVDKIAKSIKGRDSLFISNPNNPLGSLLDPDHMKYLVRRCAKENIFLIVDEAFMDFVKDGKKVSLLKDTLKNKNLLVLRSLTKFFALPGLRAGYLAAGRKVIRKMSYFRQPWSVNSLAQACAEYAIKDDCFIQKSINYISGARDRLFNALNKTSYLKPYPAAANFIFCEITKVGLNSRKICDYCGKRGLLIRDCSDFRGLNNHFIRIAVRKDNENNNLVKVLNEIS